MGDKSKMMNFNHLRLQSIRSDIPSPEPTFYSSEEESKEERG